MGPLLEDNEHVVDVIGLLGYRVYLCGWVNLQNGRKLRVPNPFVYTDVGGRVGERHGTKHALMKGSVSDTLSHKHKSSPHNTHRVTAICYRHE